MLLLHRRSYAAAPLSVILALAAGACHRSAATPAGAKARAPALPPSAPLTAAPRPRPTGPRGKVISIVYSSNLLGDYEPCG